jgi:hypothetical protein
MAVTVDHKEANLNILSTTRAQRTQRRHCFSS